MTLTTVEAKGDCNEQSLLLQTAYGKINNNGQITQGWCPVWINSDAGAPTFFRNDSESGHSKILISGCL
jgi:hypothetical protein